ELNQGTIPAKVVLREGRAAESIIAHAAIVEADLVVLASHARVGLGRALFGSLADRLVSEVNCPVILIRPAEGLGNPPSAASRSQFHRIVVPLDGSPEAEQILPGAEALARAAGGALYLTRMVRPIHSLGGTQPMPEVMVGSAFDEDATQRVVSDAEEYLERI